MSFETEEAWTKMTTQYDVEDCGTVAVFRLCPDCGLFVSLKNMVVFANLEGNLRFEGVECKKHGQIQPHYEYV